MNTQNDKKLKERDTLNRRQESRKAESFHDVLCSRYFTVGADTFRYKLKTRPYCNDYAVYYTDPDNNVECVGFASPSNKHKIKIIVRRHGLDWETIIPISKIKCWGHKTPDA